MIKARKAAVINLQENILEFEKFIASHREKRNDGSFFFHPGTGYKRYTYVSNVRAYTVLVHNALAKHDESTNKCMGMRMPLKKDDDDNEANKAWLEM